MCDIAHLQFWFETLLGCIFGYSPFERLITQASFFDWLLALPTASLLGSSFFIKVERYILLHYPKEAATRALYDGKDTPRKVAKLMASCMKVNTVKYGILLIQIVEEVRQKERAFSIIKKCASVAPRLEEDDDKNKLLEVWKFLTDRPYPPSFSHSSSFPDPMKQETSWADIGFQNPLRDFRGVGQLGLKNLLYFAKIHRLRAREVLEESLQPAMWFPFAATGLNITMWLLEFLRAGQLSCFFYRNSMKPLEIFNAIYCFSFLEFSRFWKISRPADILQFGKISLQFKKRLQIILRDLSKEAPQGEWNLAADTGEQLIEELRWWIDGEIHPHRNRRRLYTVMNV
ncbi:hypothetical protein IE077_002680 [Cardiosporidium cionae]|uniref:ELMO domain-containing protein n=1 Tax=Cardiosporidium cionae TaxID=476202 RepID=A0ABQ7JA67_9APIC|nr:hypothetical protein IE077_002680 [Cardiosporidium cionae]|eukprot:KAF8820896.1 hypothetical protein IE077_002680 [Cardiosporidium cionae]